MSRNFRIAGGLAILVVLLAAPLAVGNYGYYILATVMIYAMVALSLNILIGMGGQISIGHAGFWALGAYASALSVIKLGMPFLAGVAVGGFVAALFGALVALPALRVQGHYLAIATLGFALFVQQVGAHDANLGRCGSHPEHDRRDGHVPEQVLQLGPAPGCIREFRLE